jgi:hypothetical protein
MFNITTENITGLVLVCLGLLLLIPWCIRAIAIFIGIYLIVIGIKLMKR